MSVLFLLSKFFRLLIFGNTDVGITFYDYCCFILNYPIYLVNCFAMNNSDIPTYFEYLTSKSISFVPEDIIAYTLSTIALVGLVWTIFKLIKRCLSFGRC